MDPRPEPLPTDAACIPLRLKTDSAGRLWYRLLFRESITPNLVGRYIGQRWVLASELKRGARRKVQEFYEMHSDNIPWDRDDEPTSYDSDDGPLIADDFRNE